MKFGVSTKKRVEAFDLEHRHALKRIWFAGDVHGEFWHIEAALEASWRSDRLPSWLVFLGDLDIDSRPLREILVPLVALAPQLQVAFIHGNHDADSYAHWECLHDCGTAVALHGRVVDLDGIRVAGLGGNFLRRVWAPPTQPAFANKVAAMHRGAHGWRDGQRPNPKFHGAIYPDDVAALERQGADILVTHEAPSCHPYGWETMDQLIREMGVLRAFHGHTHDDLSDAYAQQREDLGFDARAVNYRKIKNGLGETVDVPYTYRSGA